MSIAFGKLGGDSGLIRNGYVALRSTSLSGSGAMRRPGIVAPGRDSIAVRNGMLGMRVTPGAFILCGFIGTDGGWGVGRSFGYWREK